MTKGISETSKFAVNVVKCADNGTSKYSALAEQYGERFAAFFGCSTKLAKQMLSSPNALIILNRIRNDFGQYFSTMNSTQIANFIKGLDSRKAKLAKRAFEEGISFHDIDKVYSHGTSIFDKSENNHLLKELKHTSKGISLFSNLQNGQNNRALV